MGDSIHYFIFNKESDYRRGYLQDMEVWEGGIRPVEGMGKKGIFISQILDSRMGEMSWHRFRIRTDGGRQPSFRLSVYAGNERNFVFQELETDLEAFIRREDVALEEKLQFLSPWLQKRVAGQEEILLHEVHGRYLWFVIEMYWQQDAGRLFDIRIHFPGQSWIEYLPEVYRREDRERFLERYLGIFQSIYEDVNEWIRKAADNFNVETAEGEDLLRLAGWLGIEACHIWQEEKLRCLLRRGVSMYKRRGTRQGMMEFIALYTGEYPYIVENHQIQVFCRERKHFVLLQSLYGSNPYVFTVLVREACVGAVWQQKALMRLIEEVKPAHMEARIVFLKPYLFMEKYSYLGINSVLGRYARPVLDGQCALPFAVLEKGL